jgi:colicin import membrane protein
MQRENDTAGPLLLSIGLHVVVALLAWLAAFWTWKPPPEPAAGEPIGATLVVSPADTRRAEQLIASAQKAPPRTPEPQPLPEPHPQQSPTPIQPTPQAPVEHPDTVEQEAVVRNAVDPDEQARQEQEARHRQEQVDLTQDIARQQEVERRQRLQAQIDAIRREREQAAQLTRMEAQRLAQLADRMPTPAPTPTHAPTPPRDTPPASGERGVDTGLLARYKAALNATARSNWNTGLAPELTTCRVRFTQVPGGEVINVEFMDCPYDAQARESVERALRKTPMPYSGFESVFSPKIELKFCYPEEACQP